jgi:GNAT superfamily N-acetyltransferase/gluconate kinase
MIILITGASHTGKTLLAQRMLEKYKYPYLSIDHLKMGLIRSGNTNLTPLDDEALTDYLWPIVREMIKTAIENRQNLIVEGCYVPFDWRKDFAEVYLADIRFICLAMTGDYIDKHHEDIIGSSSVIESRLDDSDCTLSSLKEDNQRICEGSLKAGEQVTLIDESFERVIEVFCRDDREKGYQYVTLRERPDLKETAATWFHGKWNVPEEAYLECMEAYLNGATDYGWYLCLDGSRIIGGMGVIENDFHDRKDLSPNVCAVYTEEGYRCQGIAGKLLNMVVEDLRSKGISPLYLVTNHTGFYERYGWEFLCLVQGDGEPELSRMYIHK